MAAASAHWALAAAQKRYYGEKWGAGPIGEDSFPYISVSLAP